jgi:hypothetical protein
VRPEHSSAELFEPEATQAAPTQEGEQIMRNTMLATLLLVAGAATMAGSGPAAAAIDYPYCIQGKGVGIPGDCSYRSYAECMATASGRDVYCNVNPRVAFGQPRRGRPYRDY